MAPDPLCYIFGRLCEYIFMVRSSQRKQISIALEFFGFVKRGTLQLLFKRLKISFKILLLAS